MYQIIIIEDDPVIREELSAVLQGQGYSVQYSNDFSNATAEIQACNPNLILLDINLPAENGFQICSKIRTFSNVPIIFVTSRNTDMDELNSIMLGGDDFVAKPYNIPILLARIASLLKRVYSADVTESITYRGIILHLESGKIEFDNKTEELTKNELKIMAYLLKNAGKIVPRADLMENLWDNQLYVDDNTLSVNIARLRDKLKQIGVVNFIRTKHRQGYIV